MSPIAISASVVIPAHNEEAALRRLLAQLCDDLPVTGVEVLVVCNGCTDRTADVARSFGHPVRVVELSQPSKATALRVADQHTSLFPRVYLDADVEIGWSDVRRLVETIESGAVLACAPSRSLSRHGVTTLARCYYDVWERLPQVRSGLFGRGAVAVSAAGHRRIDALPPMLADDLVMSEAFAANERTIVSNSVVVVHPARTLPALLDRRVRVATGNIQASRADLRSAEATTTLRSLARLAAHDRVVAMRLPVFLAVTALARLRSARRIRSGDFTTWQRDDSSRVLPT